MKKVTFRKIFIKNFLSVGKEPLIISFKNGFNVISGINRDENNIKNGVGKTLIVDALYFAIFGETLREISKQAFVVNRQTKGRCEVKLAFSVENNGNKDNYIITRTLNDSSFEVIKNKENITQASIADSTKYVTDLLSADRTIWQNCVVLRANATVPFMAKKKQEKKNFIESIFRLNIFSDMAKLLKEDTRDIKTKLDVVQSTISRIEEHINGYNQEIAKHKDAEAEIKKTIGQQTARIKDDIKKETQRKNDLLSNVQNLAPLKEDLLSDVKKYKNQQNLLQKATDEKYKCEVAINVAKKDLEKLNSTGDVCPLCKRPYEEAHKNEVRRQKADLKQEIRASEIKRGKCVTLIEKTKAGVSELESVIQKKKEEYKRLQNASEEVKQIDRNISRLESQLSVFNEQKESSIIKSFEELIKKEEADLKANKEENERLKKGLQMFSMCDVILSEYGVRAYIVNKLLNLLNERIEFYLSSFKSLFHFTFNQIFEEEIVDDNGVVCQYGNCSGAESKKIDLAVAFAFNDVLKFHQQTQYNLMFFDEILDSSLDAQSLSTIISFINEYVQENEKASYLITHKSDVDLPEISDNILLEKKDGFTYLVQPKKPTNQQQA